MSNIVQFVFIYRYIVSFDGSGDNKQSKSIHINKQLDLSNYQFDHSKFKTDAQPLKYRLVSMVEHIGDSLNCGHYTALGLTPSGFFYNFNDSNVCIYYVYFFFICVLLIFEIKLFLGLSNKF